MRTTLATLLIIILILLLTIKIMYNTNQTWKAEAERESLNVEALIAEKSEMAIRQNLTISELKNRYGKVIDSLGYKLKRVEGLTKVQIRYKTRAVQLWRDSIVHDTIRLGRIIQVADSCLKIKVTDQGDTARIESDLTLNAFVIYYRGKRVHPFWKFWNNTRTPMVKVHTNCGQVQVSAVEVRK
jgi:hypothetical protein